MLLNETWAVRKTKADNVHIKPPGRVSNSLGAFFSFGFDTTTSAFSCHDEASATVLEVMISCEIGDDYNVG